MGQRAIVIASDSYKGSATSLEVEQYIEEGIRRAVPDASIRLVPIADGGEGTLDALVPESSGGRRQAVVRGPWGQEVTASYGMREDAVCVIEMAQASGLGLNRGHAGERATTYGTGQLIKAALDAGAKRILVGLGGSATSDGGKGMAEALGVRFLDADGAPVAEGLAGLERLSRIDVSGLDPRLKGVQVRGLTDVTNPLIGPLGAIPVFGPQKGLAEERMPEYEQWMERYAELVFEATGRAVADFPGAGAAGGLGAGLHAFLGADLVSGIDCVLDTVGFDKMLEDCVLVITGEGRMDRQSARGKAPVGVARRAKHCGIPVIAVVGSRADDIEEVYNEGISVVIPTIGAPRSLEECISRVATDIPLAGETAGRIFLLMDRAWASTDEGRGGHPAG